MNMEDGFSILREWLSPHIESGPPTAEMVSSDRRNLEYALRQVLLNAVLDGARDVDIRTFPDPVTGQFTVVEFSHTADGPDFTQLKTLLAAGGREIPPHDWTQERVALPVGPAGCVLTVWRTHAAGATLETWLQSDGTAEIHVVDNAFGQRIAWFLSTFSQPEFMQVLPKIALRTNLRLHINNIHYFWHPNPHGVLQSVTLKRPWGECTLYQLNRPDGDIRLFYRGFEIQRQPCPVPFLHFDWNSRFQLNVGNAQNVITQDFLDARTQLETVWDPKHRVSHFPSSGFLPNHHIVDLLKPQKSFQKLLQIWKRLCHTIPELKDLDFQLGFLQSVSSMHWPLFLAPINSVYFPVIQQTHLVALLPDFPATHLSTFARLQYLHPQKPSLDVGMKFILILNHPFVLHVFSIISPEEALYLLIRIFLLKCNIETTIPDFITKTHFENT